MATNICIFSMALNWALNLSFQSISALTLGYIPYSELGEVEETIQFIAKACPRCRQLPACPASTVVSQYHVAHRPTELAML